LYDWVRGAPKCLQAIATYVVIRYTYKAIRTRPRLRPGDPLLRGRAYVHTYTADLGRRMSYVHRIRVQKTRAICRGRFQCNNALCPLQGTYWQGTQCYSLSSTGTSWEATTSTGQYQYTGGSTVSTWNLQNKHFIASNSNCLLLADHTKDPKGN
jgi:hypothetical protein